MTTFLPTVQCWRYIWIAPACPGRWPWLRIFPPRSGLHMSSRPLREEDVVGRRWNCLPSSLFGNALALNNAPPNEFMEMLKLRMAFGNVNQVCTYTSNSNGFLVVSQISNRQLSVFCSGRVLDYMSGPSWNLFRFQIILLLLHPPGKGLPYMTSTEGGQKMQ